jgi:hypothetical protein
MQACCEYEHHHAIAVSREKCGSAELSDAALLRQIAAKTQ